MDPKLQNFLEATGWSKEDLIRKLSAGEKSKSAVVNDLQFVSSTTPNKATSTLQEKMPHINCKTSNTVGNKEIVGIDLYSDIPLPPSFPPDSLPPPPIPPIPPPESFLSDDLLRQLNTSNSYLPPLYSRDSPTPSDIGQSGVIDLVSDTESVDLKENNADDTQRAKVIDISDSDESVKVIENSGGGTQVKTAIMLVDDTCNSNTRAEASQWEKLVEARFADRDLHGGDTPRQYGKRRGKHKRQHRSSSSNHRHEDWHYRKAVHSSRSRSRSPSRSRRRRDRSGSSSVSRENLHRSRKRTRSDSKEHDAVWYSKASRSAGFYPSQDSYNFPRMSDPYIYTRRVKKATKDTLLVVPKKKRKSVIESNNLSENNIANSNTQITYRNIVAGESENNILNAEPKQKTQKIELKRRDLKNLHEDLQKLMNQAFEIDLNDQTVSDAASVKMPSQKTFIENKNKHLASEVSQLISNEKQSSNRAPTNKSEPTDKSVRVPPSTDTIVIDDDEDETESTPNIEIENSTPNDFSNTSPDRNCLNITDSTPLNILEAEDLRIKQILDQDFPKQINSNGPSSSAEVPVSISEDNSKVSACSLDEQMETDKVNKVPKLQHLVMEHLSDISEYTSGDFTDDTDTVAAECCGSNNKGSGDTRPENLMNSEQMDDKIGKQLRSKRNYLANEDLSDISDYELTEDVGDSIAVELESEFKENNTETVNCVQESSNHDSTELSPDNSLVDLTEKAVCSKLEKTTENASPSIVDFRSDDVLDRSENSDRILNSQEPQTSTPVQLRDELEIPLTELIEERSHKNTESPDCPNELITVEEEQETVDETMPKQDSINSQVICLDHAKLTVERADEMELDSMKPIEEKSEPLVAEDISNSSKCPSEGLTNNTELMRPVEDLSDDVEFNEELSKDKSTEIVQLLSDSPNTIAVINQEETVPQNNLDKTETNKKSQIIFEDQAKVTVVLEDEIEIDSMKPIEDLSKEMSEDLVAEDISNSSKYPSEGLTNITETDSMKPVEEPCNEIESTSQSEPSPSDEDVSKDNNQKVANKSKIQPSTAEDISKCPSVHNIETASMENIDDLSEDDVEQVEFARSAESISQLQSAFKETTEASSKKALDEIVDSSKSQCFIDDDLNLPGCSFEDITDAEDTEDSPLTKPTEIVFVDAQDAIINSPESTRCITEDSVPDPLIDDEDVEMKSLEDDPHQICHNSLQSQSLTTDVLDIFEKDNNQINIGTDSDLENSILNAVELIDDDSISDLLNEVIEEDSTSDEASEKEDVRVDNDNKIGSTEKLADTNQEDGLKDCDSKSVDDNTDQLPTPNHSATKDATKIESVAEVSKSTSAQIVWVSEVSKSTPVQIVSVSEVSNLTSDEAEQSKILQKSVELERGSIIESRLLEVRKDDSIALDIETILRKCTENQERALRDQAKQKTPCAVRRAPKNRRPDFSSLRDNSMSTIQINLLLEQLCNRNSAETKKLTPKLISTEESPDKKIAMAGYSKTIISNFERERFDFGKPFYDRNVKDDIRNEILKQLDILKDKRNDAAFSTSTNPTIIPKAKKTFAKLRQAYNEQDDEEEINIVNDNLESPVIWLTKTNDYTKIKGWKNKLIGVKTKKSSRPVWKTADEDLAVPSCSFHYPSFVDNIIENVVSDNANEIEEECIVFEECSTSAEIETEVIESQVSKEIEAVETNPFSSSILDNFMLDKSEVELKISFEVPELLMGPRIVEPQKIHDNFLRGDVKTNVETPVKKDLLTKEGVKPRTVAEKRKLLKLEEARHIPLKPTTYNIKPPVSKPVEVSRITLRNPTRRTVNEDLPNVGHNKRKDFATASVYWKGKKYLVPCRERKAIYFRTKILPRYETTAPSIVGSPTRIEPSKAVLWSPEKIIQKPVPIQKPKSNIIYKAGPMCKKPELIVDHSWKCIVKPLPKVFLEITAEYGKSLHPRALQFLYANPYVDLSKDKVDFALTALKDSKPTKYRLPLSYENGQTQFTLRKKEMRIEVREPPKTPPACGDISSEVKDVVNDMLSCLEIHEIQETFIKDDPDFDPHEKPKPIADSKCKKDIKESAVTTRVAAINKRLRIALGRLQVKFIDINIDEDPNKACDKAYCQYGCVCSSLVGALASKEHCRRIECVFGCICGYKPPVNTTVTLPAGSDLDLFSTVDKLQSEATKNLAKVEKEFTQTIVCTKNETYVLGDTTDRKRRCTRVPKKYEEFLKAKEVPKDFLKDGEETKPAKEETSTSHSDFIRKTYGVDITECSVRIEKVDMYHIIPFCWRHEEYQCQCLKEFLIARSEEKANILASQQDNVDDEANLTTQADPGQKLTKYGLRKNLKKKRKKYYVKKSELLKLKNAEEEVDAETNSDRTKAASTTSNITVSKPDGFENQPTKSASRRKQVLNTMVDISEKQNIRLRVEPVKAAPTKLVPPSSIKRSTESKLMQKADRDSLRFLLPTANVRQQFLKMLGKKEDAQDHFRLLSFLVLSNRFHRFLFHVWFSRAAITSKYILTMENIRPTQDAINVKYFPDDMRSDNYLIQWLMEGSIPVTEVQDFLVILRVIDSKSFDICGMCEKSKIEYTDEPSSPLPLTPPKEAAAAPILVPTTSSTVPTMTYNINGSARQPRKILNIQNQKIPSINVVYPSVALTGQSGLIHASLPSINAKFRWLMMSFSSTFAVLNMTTSNYCVPHEYLVELVEQSKRANCTMMFKNREIRGQAAHPEFAIYVTPQHNRYIFIGPYHVQEELTCETLCYYKNMLVSTENFHKIHGNPITPVGSWIKQLQMKVHSAATISVSSPTSILKSIVPKVTATSPPQLVRISDFIAAKNGKQTASVSNQNVGTPNTSLLIVNNSIVSSCVPKSSAPIANANISKSSSSTTAESTIPNTNVATDDICLLGLDYRDAEFKDKSNKTLQYLVTNIPGFGYIRIYRCHKTNIIYLMWRFVKMYKTLIEAKKALVTLIESTVIIAPSNFKVTISLLNQKPPNLKLIDSDYYFDTYIAGRFGVHLLSKLNLSKMTSCLRLDEVDVQYINERSSEMLLKKCYNIASTFLTKDDLAKIRNWKDMMAALKGTVDSELQIDTTLTKELKKQRQKYLALRKKLQSLTNDAEDCSILSITPVKATSEVIEISDDDDDDELMPKLQPEIITEGQPAITPATSSPSNQCDRNQSPISDKTKTNTHLQRSVGFVSMAQNFQGSFKLLPHNQNSVLITRIKNPPPAPTKTNTNNL